MQRPRGVLAARNIAKSYGDTVVLENLSVTITPASRIGIVGPNGIGKSTLLRLLAEAEEPDSGVVSRELPELSVARHRGGLVVVSHDRSFLEGMTSILEFEAETRRVREYHGGWQQFEEQRAAARARHESAYATYTVERKRVEEHVRRMRRW